MKKQLFSRTFINAGLLLSTIILLSSCAPLDWIKNKMGCESCSSGADHGASRGEPLLSINGKPAITVEGFEDFWNTYLESNPQAAAYASFYPNVRHEMFKNNLVPLEVAKAWVKAEGKDKDSEYQKKIRKQQEFLESFTALEMLKDHVIKNIDTSDEALNNFYNENREKVSIFQQAPFMKSPVSMKAQVVQFTDEKQAKDFLEKAEKKDANFASLAKAANKTIKDVDSVQTKDLDPVVRAKLKDMNTGDVTLVTSGKNQFKVVKVVSKQDATYAQFEEVKGEPEVKEAVKQAIVQIQGSELFGKKLEELKEKFNVKEHTEFFDKERESKQADLQAKLKEMQAKEEPKEEAAKTAVDTAMGSAKAA